MRAIPSGTSVEEWNDALAREHDIDAYYRDANPVVRVIESHRLRLIRTLLDPKPGERLLEVGCGGGHVLERFPECDLVGIDVSSEMLVKASARLAGLRVEFRKGELHEVGLEPESFDAVICSEVLEHVVDPDAVLDSVRAHMKPTGRAVVTFPNDPFIARAKGVLRRSGLALLPPFKRTDWGGDQYHLHTWTVSEMRSLLRRHFNLAREAHAPSRLTPIRCCFLVVAQGA